MMTLLWLVGASNNLQQLKITSKYYASNGCSAAEAHFLDFQSVPTGPAVNQSHTAVLLNNAESWILEDAALLTACKLYLMWI